MRPWLERLIVASALSVGESTGTLPNIVILFADNLSAQDVGTERTPNVASIALEGINFTNWNSAAHLCSASRAALLTGRYPVRCGIYPGVFKPDAVHGLSPDEVTIAEYLKDVGYATSIVGKWHLGHREEYLPMNQGFDHWLGIPFPMSGGSVDNHTCIFDLNETMWLPLFRDNQIVQQPVQIRDLAKAYAEEATTFIRRNSILNRPFFLYVPFSHAHQLCAPRDDPEQSTCQWASIERLSNDSAATFYDAVLEMDWITGRILTALTDSGVESNTFVLFTSDNGPWVAEQSCSGRKGPYEGRWLRANVAQNCTACPLDYVTSPTVEDPRRCILPGSTLTLSGIHCGEDSGLGSIWEANLRMPAFVRWPDRVNPGSVSNALISTLDVFPTVLSIAGLFNSSSASKLDGVDLLPILAGHESGELINDRILFFWRDGFAEGPLPPPFGRLDVVAVKTGRIKAWFWTKSGHYNADVEVYHDPPLLFDTLADPGESLPLDLKEYVALILRIQRTTREHKQSMNWTFLGALTLERDPKYIPCSIRHNQCRTQNERMSNTILANQ